MHLNYRPYRFYYLRRHSTKQILSKVIHRIDKHDSEYYAKEIGEYLYQFKIQDKCSSWTVLKTEHQISKMMKQRENPNNHFNFHIFSRQNVNISNFGDKSFELQDLKIKEFGSIIPHYLIKFFEIYNSNISKVTSLKMFKKVRGMTWIKRLQNWCCGVEWDPKHIFVTKEGILEIVEDGTVTDFLKFDLYFSLQSGSAATGHEFGIALYSAQRKVVLRASNIKDFVNFIFYTRSTLEGHKAGINYLGSCKPTQANCINFLIDAQSYYFEAAKQMQKARKSLLLCGWWISPQLYLIRPVNKQNEQFRLDKILKRKAEAGVKIFIIVFLAPSIIPNDSQYTKKTLANLHPNITVERHPHQVLPKLWSHHEKVIVIDEKVALMGGLDLCYGRYDTKNHPININNKQMYPGIDYNNVRIKDFIQVRKFQSDLQNRNLPRMPWHDVAFKVKGRMVADVANHFIEYWNFTLLQKKIAPIALVNQQEEVAVSSKQNLVTNVKLKTSNLNNMDFIVTIMKMSIESNSSFSNKQKTEMIDFISNKSKREQYDRAMRSDWINNKFQFNNGAGEKCMVLSIESLGLIKEDETTKNKKKKIFTDQLQLLRSASEWSIGLQHGVIQRSIQNAYLSLIKNAKSFIYIENQFFISGTGNKDSYVSNQIANALYERIKKAIHKKQKFKVVVFMPLLPGMEGELSQNCPLGLKLTMFWQYNTISQSQQALISRIARLTSHPEDYIQFYSLRSHGLLSDQPVTQLIYIHTKLMIVDDDIVLCGSANINDRSQQGDRDSELAVIFTNGQKKKSKMNGFKVEVNRKAHSLRSKLFQQHFGMSEQEAEDPISLSTVENMRKIAKTNTESFRQIFGCCPDDNVKKLSEVKNFLKTAKKQRYQDVSKKIKGHVVQFPTMFLSDEKLYSFDLNMIQDIFT